MDRQRMMFCPDMGELTRRNMVGLLAATVFGDERFVGLLEARYDQMGSLFRDAAYDADGWNLAEFECENVADRTKKDARLKVPQDKLNSNKPGVMRLFAYGNFGHDLPVWFSYSNDRSAKRVMIISQDPKRDNDAPGNLYLSTPFGFHCKDWRKGNAQVRKIISRLMESGCCVYLTDSMKFFAGDGTVVRESIIDNDRDGYKDTFSAMLNSEITVVNPDVIIKLGDDVLDPTYICSTYTGTRDARDGLDFQEIGGRQVIAAYHPSGTRGAINTIRQLVNNDPHPVIAYYERIIQMAIDYLSNALI